jgi:hemerythrin-like domain-containing protein
MPSKSARGASQPVAIELLTADHRKVEQLFEQFESEKDDTEAKTGIAERVCGELKVHAQVEEELFYPWLKENLDDDDQEMVAEATIEHQSAKDLIAKIEECDPDDEQYDALVKVLSEYIKHHVKEEEQEIFPKVASMADELNELGQEIAARKAELMEEMGLEDESGTPPPAKAQAGHEKRAR